MRKALGMMLALLAIIGGSNPASAFKPLTAAIVRQFGSKRDDQALATAVNVVVGVRRSLHGEDGFVRYFGAHGATKWSVSISTPGDDRATAVAETSRRIFVAGTTTGSLVRSTNEGGTDGFVRSYSLAGRLKWTRQFGTSQDDVVTGIGAGDLSGLSVVGWTDGDLAAPSTGGADVFVRHLLRVGTLQWTTQFGSSGNDRATCVDQYSPDLVCGSTDGTLTGQTSAGGQDAFIARLDQGDGSVTWIRQFGTAADDAASGTASLQPLDLIAVGGVTQGTFPGATSQGGSDAFVASFSGISDPALADVKQFGTSGDETVSGLESTSMFAYMAGTTTGSFPGESSAGGTDLWAAQLDLELGPGPGWGTVWVEQTGSPADDLLSGISGPIDSTATSTATFLAGGTGGAMPGQVSRGGEDAFWWLQFEPIAVQAQDTLTRGLAVAHRYLASNGSYDGLTWGSAAALAPAFEWISGAEAPTGTFSISIGEASGSTVRLVGYSWIDQTYFCLEEVGGSVTYGHSATFDPTSCSGGW